MIKYSYFYIKKSFFISVLLIFQLIFLILSLYNSFDIFTGFNIEKKQISKFFSDEILYGIEFRSDLNSSTSNDAFSNAEKIINDYLNTNSNHDFFLTLNSIEPLSLEKFDNYENFKFPNSPEKDNKFYAKSLHINSDSLKRFPINLYEGRTFNDTELTHISSPKDTIPIILGYDFLNIYHIGDIITIDSSHNAEVIGILSKDQFNPGNLQSSQRFANLNNYIIIPNNYLDNGAYLTGAALLIFDKSTSKEYINNIRSDLRNLFNEINISIDVRDFSSDLYSIINMYLNGLKDKSMISIIITIFIFLSITITLLNSILLYKKDFGVHYLTGARTIDIIKIISGELFILSFVAIILSTPIFIFKGLTNKINVIALLSTFIFLLIMNLIILIIPIVNINKIQLNQLIKGED